MQQCCTISTYNLIKCYANSLYLNIEFTSLKNTLRSCPATTTKTQRGPRVDRCDRSMKQHPQLFNHHIKAVSALVQVPTGDHHLTAYLRQCNHHLPANGIRCISPVNHVGSKALKDSIKSAIVHKRDLLYSRIANDPQLMH